MNCPCALLIPIHEKHFHYIYNLINKMNNAIPLYLVFSDEEQLNKFEMKDKIIPFIYSKESVSIITEKKFYGLKQLIDSEHEYIIVCDAETDIVPENFNIDTIMKKIKEIFINKKIYGGEINGDSNYYINRITVASMNVFIDQYDRQKILHTVDPNKYIYTWWSDLPVYKRDHLVDFFSKINTDKLLWECFDNMIYNYYLLIYQDFQLVNITPILNIRFSMEKYVPDNMDKILELEKVDYGFSWVFKIFFHKYKDYLIKKGTIMIYHLDR